MQKSILILTTAFLLNFLTLQAQLPTLFQDSYDGNGLVPSTSNLFVWKDNLYMYRTVGGVYGASRDLWQFDSNQNANKLADMNVYRAVTSNNYMMFQCNIPSSNNNVLNLAFSKTGDNNDFVYSSQNGITNYAIAKNDTFYVSIADNNYVYKFWRMIPTASGVSETMLSTPNNLWIEKHCFYKGDIYFVGVIHNSSNLTRYLYRIRNNQVQFIRSNIYDIHLLGNEMYVSSYSGYLYYLDKGTIDNNGYINWKTLKYYTPNEGFYMGLIKNFTTFKDKIYFVCSLAYVGEQLCYISNDTIKLVKLNSYISNSVSVLGKVNDKLIFESRNLDDDGKRLCLWASDGTANGTKIINYNVRTGLSGYYTLYNGGEKRPANFQNRIFFLGTTDNEGEEVWFTDGTSSGTKMLMDINQGTGNSRPTDFIAFNNRLYFVAYHPTYGSELWYFQPNCLSERNISGVSIQDEGSLDYLNSSQKIIGNVNREYKASKALILNNGFEVEAGSVFKTILDYGCQY